MNSIKELFSSPKKAAVVAACILVVLVTAGICVGYAAGALAQAPSDAIGGDRARDFACADAGVDPAAAQGVQVKFDRFQGGFVYEVEFVADGTQYEYKIDASDGSVVKKESKTVRNPGDGSPPPSSVTLEEARSIALADAGAVREEAVFTEAELDEENGTAVYEFKFFVDGTEYGYEINARTGEVYSKQTVVYVGQGAGAAPSVPAGGSSGPDVQPGSGAQDQTGGQTQAGSGAVQGQTGGQAQTGSGAVPSPADGMAPPTAGIVPPSPPQWPEGQGRISLDEAKEAALADAGVSASEVTYTKTRMDYEDGIAVYDIEFYTAAHEYEYEINAATGAVYSKSVEAFDASRDRGGWHHDETSHFGDNCIGVEQAKSACLNHAGCSDGQVVFSKAELDYEDGRAVYEVEFYKDGVEYEYKIDAVTGEVVEYEWG